MLVSNITAKYQAGGITQTLIPNVIYVDYADAPPTATCVELNQLLLGG